jgi:hypothetical protein
MPILKDIFNSLSAANGIETLTEKQYKKYFPEANSDSATITAPVAAVPVNPNLITFPQTAPSLNASIIEQTVKPKNESKKSEYLSDVIKNLNDSVRKEVSSAPAGTANECSDLELIKEEPGSLIDLMETVKSNYIKYYKCAAAFRAKVASSIRQEVNKK